MIDQDKLILGLDRDRLLLDETLLTVANGYVGMRGNFEEGFRGLEGTRRGSYINGFYDDVEIRYGKKAYGFPERAQRIVNLPDAQGIRLVIDGDLFELNHGRVHHVKRWLDIDQGIVFREVDWTSPKGHRLTILIKRMASFEMLELVTIEYEVTSHNYSGDITIESDVVGNVFNYINKNDPRVDHAHHQLIEVNKIHVNNDSGYVSAKTMKSGLTMTVTMTHSHAAHYEEVGHVGLKATFKINLKENEHKSFTKYLVYTDSKRHGHTEAIGEAYMREVLSHGAEDWYKAQKGTLKSFWSYAKVTIEGDDQAQEALDYAIYQLMTSAGRDGYSQISANGLSGEGHEGHYFWDTEIFMLPFFTLTNPELAKELMRFRHNTLDHARARALELGHKRGAKIPWRTISGSECSTFFPTGTAQYHINSDVAYSYIQYYLYTNDKEFMVECGLEVLLETARLWMEMGHFTTKGDFVLQDVTGPDEYTAIVNNNFYTNVLAKYHLYWTVKLWRKLMDAEHITYYHHFNLTDEELALMLKASEQMLLLYDEELGVDLQDDSFKDKKPWDFDQTPRDQYPLLRHYHPLTIYRHKVLKQADTVLAHFLLDNRDLEVMDRSYHYYEAYTTHDSSLSLCVYAMMAARIGEVDKAYDYFVKTLRLDLDDLHHNTKEGLHIANAGGAYMTVIYGFGGLRIKEDGLHLRPSLPKQWRSYQFHLNYHGHLVEVTVKKDAITIKTATPLDIWINEELHTVHHYLEQPL